MGICWVNSIRPESEPRAQTQSRFVYNAKGEKRGEGGEENLEEKFVAANVDERSLGLETHVNRRQVLIDGKMSSFYDLKAEKIDGTEVRTFRRFA